MDGLSDSPLSNFSSGGNYANDNYDDGNYEYDEEIDGVSDGSYSPVNAPEEYSVPRGVNQGEYYTRDYDNSSGYSEDDDDIDDSSVGNFPLKTKTPLSKNIAHDNSSGYSEDDDDIDDSLVGNLPLKTKTPLSKSIAHDKGYIKDLWNQENDAWVGWNETTSKWTGNKAPEANGGRDYGPALKLKYKSGGYTQGEIDRALTSKIEDIETKLRKDVREHGKNYDSLNRDQKMLLVDYSYNTGDAFKKFPKFSKALINGDRKTMSKEYKRTFKNEDGERQELTKRNKWTKSVIDNM